MEKNIGILLFKNAEEEKPNLEAARLMEEAAAKGLSPRLFYFYLFSVFFAKGKLEIYYDNKKFNPSRYTFFLARYNLTRNGIYDNYSIGRYLELKGLKIINTPEAAFLAKNKRDSLVILSAARLPITPTGINYSHFFLDEQLKRNKGRIVAKANSSSLGYSVSVLDSHISFISFMEFIGSSNIHTSTILIQPFINSENEDYRIIVVGGKVVVAMKRKARGIEFRSNISKGGAGKKIKVSKKMADLAIKATKILGLDYAGVDIMKEKSRYMIVEVNSNPGLEIETITGVNIAEKIINHAIKKSK